MAGKIKSMSQIKQLLILHQQGKGIKTIARTLSMSKNTVRAYLQKLEAMSSCSKHVTTIGELLKLENPELEAKFHAGSPAYKEDRYEHFKSQIGYFIKELNRTGVSRQLLWQEYKQQNPNGYGYSQFCFHLHQQRVAAKPSMVLEHKPGEKLFIDFAGKKLYYVDKSTGEMISCEVFVACLPYSDYSFVMAVKSQTVGDVLYALGRCLSHLGGVPMALVPDNFKAAVVEASPYEPKINQALEDFANHYQTAVVPARVRKPKDKALVENQVKLIYSRVYAKLRNMTFFDIESLNEAISEKTREHNQTRMQQKPYCREELFLAEEKQHLKQLPTQPFELKHYRVSTVAKNNYIYFSEDKHYYSVPYTLIGQKVKVIYTRSMVHIYANQKPVAVHPRDYRAGEYSTHRNHLCSEHRYYLDRSPEYYLKKAKKRSQVLYELIDLIFKQDKYPEQLYKSCEGLFSLYRKAELKNFELACRIAIENQYYSYRFVKNILKNNMAQASEYLPLKPLPTHNNLRGKAHFQQLETNNKHKQQHQ